MQLFSRQAVTRLLSDVGYREVGVRRIRNTYPIDYWARLTPVVGGLSVTGDVLKAMRLGGVGVTLPVGNLISWGFKA